MVGIVLLAAKEHLCHISLLPSLIDSKPIYRFVMHHNSMSANCGTREWIFDLCKQYNAQHSLTIVISSFTQPIVKRSISDRGETSCESHWKKLSGQCSHRFEISDRIDFLISTGSQMLLFYTHLQFSPTVNSPKMLSRTQFALDSVL